MWKIQIKSINSADSLGVAVYKHFILWNQTIRFGYQRSTKKLLISGRKDFKYLWFRIRLKEILLITIFVHLGFVSSKNKNDFVK